MEREVILCWQLSSINFSDIDEKIICATIKHNTCERSSRDLLPVMDYSASEGSVNINIMKSRRANLSFQQSIIENKIVLWNLILEKFL